MQHRAWILTVLVLGVLSSSALAVEPDVAAQPTFYRDVLPLLQENCQECHRPKPINISGMVAPFALMTFEDARPWSKSMARAVEGREMPPWFASEEFHDVFRNERTLSDSEIETITRWVSLGSPAGDPGDAPPQRSFDEREWWLGEPDIIVALPEPVWVGDEVEDWQPNVFIELGPDVLPEGRYLRSIECQPGSEVVHHMVVYTIEEGVESGRNVGRHIGGLAPGAEPRLMPEGYGVRVEKGSTLRVNMHYHKEAGAGTGTWDQSRLGLYLYPEDSSVKEVTTHAVADWRFEIPPGEPAYKVEMTETFDRPIEVLSYLPHMHLRGTAAEYRAIFPDGSTETLLSVPRYDYGWQLNYVYPEPRTFPAGTRIEVDMVFDNSTGNASNPDPNATVRFGEKTTDEMALGWLMFHELDDSSTAVTDSGATGGP